MLQLPFFVAPLNFQPPPGYAKIPFPPPHIGSVVLSNLSASLVEKEAPQVKLLQTTNATNTNRDPYAIPADISSISPHLPSLINSLQEEQEITAKPEVVPETEEAPETEVVPETELPSKPATRRPVYRGRQRGYSTTSSTSSPRRNYGHRRRPYNRDYSRQQSTEATTLNTEEHQQLANQQISTSPNLNQDELAQNSYKSVYNSKLLRRPVQTDENAKEVSEFQMREYQTSAEQAPSHEQNRYTATFQYDYQTTTEQVPVRSYHLKQPVTTRPAAGLTEFDELTQSTPVHNQNLRVPYIPPHLQSEPPYTERPLSPVYQTENTHPITEKPHRDTYYPEFNVYNNEGTTADFKQKYHLDSSTENENQQRVAMQYPSQTSATPSRTGYLPDTAQYPTVHDLKSQKEPNDYYSVHNVPPNLTVQFPQLQNFTEHLKPSQIAEDNDSSLQSHRLQTDKVTQTEDTIVEYKTESPFKQTSQQNKGGRNRLRSRLYPSRLRSTTQPSVEHKPYDYTKR